MSNLEITAFYQSPAKNRDSRIGDVCSNINVIPVFSAALNNQRHVSLIAECRQRSATSLLHSGRAVGHERAVSLVVRCDHTLVSFTTVHLEHESAASRGDCGKKKRLTLRPLCALLL